ncbi:MAG: hypothetical protein RRY55_06455 [Bacteroidales bacterium]
MNKETKELELSGISVQRPPDISVDGECCDMVNLRNKDGMWQVTGRPHKLIASTGKGCLLKYIHANMDYRHIISYNGKSVSWEADDENSVITICNKHIADIDGISDFESVGNVLIAITKCGCRYMMFSDNSYTDFGVFIMPELSFSLKKDAPLSVSAAGSILPEFVHIANESLSENNLSFITNCFSGIYSRAMTMAQDKDLFIFPFLVRYAVRLYDGSYIKPSPKVLMYPYNSILNSNIKSLRTYSIPKDGITHIFSGEGDFSYYEYFDQYKLCFDTGLLPGKEWDEIIEGVDIFISSLTNILKDVQIQSYTLHKEDDGGDNYAKWLDVILPLESKNELTDRVINESLFYKIASLSLKELRGEDPDITINTRDLKFLCKLDSLKQNEILKIDNFSHFEMGADTSYIYNSRLHLGGIRQFFPKSFPLSVFEIKQDSYNGITPKNVPNKSKCNIKVLLKCNDGEKYVSGDCFMLTDGFISPLLSYPDRRAKEMEIKFYAQNIMISCKFPLTPSEVENCAYYIEKDLAPIKCFGKLGVASIDYKNFEEYYPNRMRVSEVNNPFFFPQEFTYSVSMGKILKMAAATAELSQGQYGEFPLYVFTNEGIWAMQQGDGKVLYASQHPVNRDVVLSSKVISGVDKAVAYVSEHGLTILHGSQSEVLSNAFDGNGESFDTIMIEEGGCKIVSEYNEIIGAKNYIKDSEIGYDYIHNELLFLNIGKQYYYSFNLNGSGWVRRQFCNSSLLGFINSYPELWISDAGGNIYNISQEDDNTDTPFIIATRNIKGVNLCCKQMKELFIRMNTENISVPLNVSVLASDAPGSNFITQLNASVGTGVSDCIRLPIHTRPYKYFRLVICGGGGNKLNMNNMIMSFFPKYTGRLR